MGLFNNLTRSVKERMYERANEIEEENKTYKESYRASKLTFLKQKAAKDARIDVLGNVQPNVRIIPAKKKAKANPSYDNPFGISDYIYKM